MASHAYCLLLFLFVAVSALASHNTQSILLQMKMSFSDPDNMLHDWTNSTESDYCFWRGVTCANLTRDIRALGLTGLGLGGEISPIIGYLESLHKVRLRGNGLSGYIPSSLSKLNHLEELELGHNNLRGKIPRSIYQSEELKVLLLSFNHLSGEIPFDIRLPQALVLDLSYNRLSGPIPAMLGSLTNITKLFLQSNNLSGPVPPELGNLTKLQFLDLSRNYLSGSIPHEFSQLRELMSLQLEDNDLSGDLAVLASCPDLTILNVSYNNFHGEIPRRDGLSRFPPDSFIGNPELCDYLPTSSCHGSHFSMSKTTIIIMIALGALGMVFVIVLVGLILERFFS